MAEKHIFYEGLVAKFLAFLTKNTRVCKKSPHKSLSVFMELEHLGSLKCRKLCLRFITTLL